MANPVAVLLYLLAALIIIVYLIRLSTKARAAERAKALQTVEGQHDDLLLKFIVDPDGLQVGETVAIDDTDLIFKDSRGFLAVPVMDVKLEEKQVRLLKPIDETLAREKGEAWRVRSHKVISYAESELPKEEPGA